MPLERYSKGYHIVRSYIHITLRNLFLKDVEVRGLENIDPNKPMILAANHQNALVDALLVGTSIKQQVLFLARADIFEKPIITKILRYFKMLPVYRIRDGYDSLKKNEDIFDQCVKYLGANSTLILFPEGNHADKRHFRSLKKGLARIAFEAESKNDFKLGLQVIPVGVDYSHYRKFRSKATVIIGDPIEISSLKEVYDQSPQKGMRQLNLAIAKGIEPNMIEIPWMDVYDSIMKHRIIYSEKFHMTSGSAKKGLLERFDSHKKLIAILGPWMEKEPEKAAELNKKADEYFEGLNKLNFRDHVIQKAPYSAFNLFIMSLGTLLMLPIYLYGLINNYLIFKIPDYFVMKVIKDTQFRSSIAYAMTFFVMIPIFYTIQTILVAIFTTGWLIPVLYLLSLVPIGLFAIHYSFWYKKLRSRWKVVFMSSGKKNKLADIFDLRKSIVKSLDEITAR